MFQVYLFRDQALEKAPPRLLSIIWGKTSTEWFDYKMRMRYWGLNPSGWSLTLSVGVGCLLSLRYQGREKKNTASPLRCSSSAQTEVLLTETKMHSGTLINSSLKYELVFLLYETYPLGKGSIGNVRSHLPGLKLGFVLNANFNLKTQEQLICCRFSLI